MMTAPPPAPSPLRASRLEPARPRPQLVRSSFLELGGTWGFAYDDADEGVARSWFDGRELGGAITVPFPPESPASGIGDTGFHPVVWYRREIAATEIAAAGHRRGNRLLLHFGAVDHTAEVWLDGRRVGGHRGGHTPFTVDLTDAWEDLVGRPVVLVVRAEDDPRDLSQPRGKQDWEREPHEIWYHRSTGIWQPVWIESVPPQHATGLRWSTDRARGTVTAEVALAQRSPTRVRVEITGDDQLLGAATAEADASAVAVTVPLARLRDGPASEDLLWRPGAPTLLDARVRVETGQQEPDEVASYLGLRSVACADGAFLVNERPVVLRSVLSQGYWPASHLAAPDPDALRREVELILALGFTAVRMHQKVEDERFLYWADRCGLMVWAEMPAAYRFDDDAMRATTAEWTEAVVRDRNHPSVVTWVPLNESWGVPDIATHPQQRAFAESLYLLTKALDPTRPVVSNDGWELAASDIWTVHDYESDGGVLRRRYDVAEDELRSFLDGIGPAGRRLRLPGTSDHAEPVMLTEFGGVKWDPDASEPGAWGYSEAADEEDFARRIEEILSAVRAATRGVDGRRDGLAGWCWTQLADTRQERNGLLTGDRRPKLPLHRLRGIIEGRSGGRSSAGSAFADGHPADPVPLEVEGEGGASVRVGRAPVADDRDAPVLGFDGLDGEASR